MMLNIILIDPSSSEELLNYTGTVLFQALEGANDTHQECHNGLLCCHLNRITNHAMIRTKD